MAAHLLTYPLPIIDLNGDPVVGGTIDFYESGGSSTPKTVYSDSTLSTSAGAQVDTDSRGKPEKSGASIEVYGNGDYYVVVKDSDGVTIDDFEWLEENDTATPATEWTTSNLSPTYISATQFSVAGDKTDILTVGRMLEIELSSTTIYRAITASAFTTVTTITVSGGLTDPITSFKYAFLSGDNQSLPDPIVKNLTGELTSTTTASAATPVNIFVDIGDSKATPQTSENFKENIGITKVYHNVSYAQYFGHSHSVSSEDATAGYCVTFSSDGTKMYRDGISNDAIYQYTLSTPYDINTAVYASKSMSHSTQTTSTLADIDISDDGTKFYIMTLFGAAYQYTLSTPYDISTGSYASKTVTISEAATWAGMKLADSGTKMFASSAVAGNDTIYQYTLSTAWDISTASYASKSYTVTEDAALGGFDISNNGQYVIVSGNTNNRFYKYELSTNFDISTASYTNESGGNISGVSSWGRVFLDSDGVYIYCTNVGFLVYEYIIYSFDPRSGL